MQTHQLDHRLHRLLSELKSLIVRECLPIPNLEISPGGQEAFTPFENGGEWGAAGEWWDFRFSARVPAHYADKIVLCAHTGREAGWEATNPQFVVRLNGRIEQAFDTKHTEMVLPKSIRPGETFHVTLNAYAKPTQAAEHLPVLRLELCDVNSELEQLCYDLDVPYQAALLQPEGERTREAALETLNRALDLLDLRRPHSEAFDEGVRAAREFLRRECDAPRQNLAPMAYATCVGHTHIDVAWLWDLYQTRHKAVRSFSTVLKLMERYPEYTFMSSQAVLYQFVKEDEPELFRRIQERVAEGRWEVEGGMWLEADCNVTGGESLVRQLLYGQTFFDREFHKLCRVLWLPDVFGYSAALPQILKLAGIDYFMTTKISWSEFNLSPYDTFTWKGIDGSEVLAHFSPTCDYASENGIYGLSHYTTYNAMLNPSQVAGGWKRFQQKGIDDHFLVSYGYGDGGGGPTEWMLENARRMEAPLPQTPVVRMGFAREFFEALDARMKNEPRLPRWSGELYLEYHRGTYTAMARNKRANRKIELMLRDAELWLTQAASLRGVDFPQAALDEIWRGVLTLQFHDILPGSSIKKVYDDSEKMYADMFGKLAALKKEALSALSRGAAGDVTAFNSLSSVRDDLVWFDAPDDVTALVDGAGAVYPVQRVEGRAVAFVHDLAPMCGTPLWFEYEPQKVSEVMADETGFETPFFVGRFTDGMRIASLIDRRCGRELVKPDEALNRIVCYENKPHNHDAWDMNIYYERRHWEVDEVQRVEVISRGPVLALVRVQYTYMDSTVAQDIIIYRDIPRIDFDTTVDWREKQYMLKAHFPVDVFYNEATYDIQYGNVKRATHKNTSWDVARFEVCAHKWADVSEDGYGVSLLNDCKYGHSIDEHGVALTLLKSSISPNPEADQETHHFVYSLMPHVGGWREGGTVQMAYRLNIPTETVRVNNGGERLMSFVGVDRENIIVEAVKQSQSGEGVVVRLYECYGRRSAGARLSLGFPFERAQVCDLLERPLEESKAENGALRFDLRPYEIKSFLFT